jgi:hypothetical protein
MRLGLSRIKLTRERAHRRPTTTEEVPRRYRGGTDGAGSAPAGAGSKEQQESVADLEVRDTDAVTGGSDPDEGGQVAAVRPPRLALNSNESLVEDEF